MKDESRQAAERISALVDGQLEEAELAQALQDLRHNDAARRSWHAYQLLGQVMRSGADAVGAHDAQFVTCLRQSLQQGSRD